MFVTKPHPNLTDIFSRGLVHTTAIYLPYNKDSCFFNDSSFLYIVSICMIYCISIVPVQKVDEVFTDQVWQVHLSVKCSFLLLKHFLNASDTLTNAPQKNLRARTYPLELWKITYLVYSIDFANVVRSSVASARVSDACRLTILLLSPWKISSATPQLFHHGYRASTDDWTTINGFHSTHE